jgi:hypothetical protein
MRSCFYDKNEFIYKSSIVFQDIYEGKTNLWGQEESKSGGGSTLKATSILREQLPFIINKYSITSMLDVPCGDYNWMKIIEKKCFYLGGDIIPEMIMNNQKLYGSDKVQFNVIDITKDPLPKVDLIFCRECLQHLSDSNVIKAIENFKHSGSKYLMVTSFPKTWRNYDILDGDYRALNLQKRPFYFPKPLLKIKENVIPGVGFDKSMNLYLLNSIV